MTQTVTQNTAQSAALTAALRPAQLAAWLDERLQASAFHDYCPNGLQVDADREIRHIVTGVTASAALIDAAIAADAQAILVHHGYFWKGEPAPLTGMKGARIRKLLQHGISLLAYHLPLDAHPTLGNNAQLARALGWTMDEPLYPEEKYPVGNIANLTTAITLTQLTAQLTNVLGRAPLHLSGGNTCFKRIGFCTGGAQDMLEQAANRGCDAFIAGEVSERTTHIARELGIDYFAAGHHATERGGVQALGDLLAHKTGLTVTFIDIDNPV